MRLLLAGVSARAAAESAARAGFAVTSIDAFGDLDQHSDVRVLVPRQGFTARRAARMARTLDYDAAVYLAGFENHPRAIGSLASGGALWGNPPDVVRRVRNPALLQEALDRRGFPTPLALAEFRVTSPESRVPQWLVKPRASGGGHRVRAWTAAAPVPRGYYLQELMDGTSGSVVFVAAGGRIAPLGVSRQLIGEAAFGASGYRYCGNVLAARDDPQFGSSQTLFDAASAVARAVTEEFGLVGVNGIDFVSCDGEPYAVEVNPRWTASLELVERAHGLSVFDAHAAACVTGALPGFDLSRAHRAAPAVGKAIVFARRSVAVGDTYAWLADPNVRDVPRPGGRIAAGQPVCTVFGVGADSAQCHTALIERAEWVYSQLAAWEPQRARARVGLHA